MQKSKYLKHYVYFWLRKVIENILISKESCADEKIAGCYIME